jgi:hypothetical protein
MPAGETLSPHVFDQYRQEKYLEFIRTGHSPTSAARHAGISPSTVKRHLQINPDLANREREAAAEALGQVEDAVFRQALGVKSPEQEKYDHDYRQFQEATYPDLPAYEPPKPNAPSLKAAELILTRLDRPRWGSDTAPSMQINVQNLLTPEGTASFHATLLERRDATLPAATLPAEAPTQNAPTEVEAFVREGRGED